MKKNILFTMAVIFAILALAGLVFLGRNMMILSFIFVAISVVFGILVNARNKKRQEQIKNLNNQHELDSSKENLIKIIEPITKAQLKSPISAIFCEPNELLISYDIDNTYDIVGYVNSQNSYGSMIKTGFRVKARYVNGKWELIKAGMENKFIGMLAGNYIIAIVITLILFAISYFIISALL